MKKIIKSKIIWTVVILFAVLLTWSFTDDDKNFGLSKSLNIYHNVIKELNMYYVDGINPKDLINKSIDNMLESLDPYTTFISEEEISDYRTMTTGEYAGIGAVIGKRGENVIIVEPYKGFPADKAGLIAGDKILKIDGKNMVGAETSDVSKLLKGEPNTPLTLLIERPYANNNPISLKIIREDIQINCVPYYGILQDNIGYIFFTNFTDKAEKTVKKALIDLQEKGVKSIIVDVRGNPGGLMDQAVKITNLFIEKGTVIVSTKGKSSQWASEYKTYYDPVDAEIPLVVLVSRGSASASEIFAGAIQDLDRGVVVGQRTYGKGLVQTTRPLSYNSQLKITTAKYYIPSGRSIQARDYTHRNEDGSVGQIPDSLISEFTTKNGRRVYDGGGILPDITLKADEFSKLAAQLSIKYVIFEYATKYFFDNKNIAPPRDFTITDENFEDFKNFLKEKDFNYQTQTIDAFERLKKVAKEEKYDESAQAELLALENLITPDLDKDLELFKKEIKELISYEIAKRYYYKEGGIENSLKDDNILKEAIKLLKDPSRYASLLDGSLVADSSKR